MVVNMANTLALRREQWRKRVMKYRQSGQSQAAWSRENKVSQKSLSRWNRILPTEQGKTEEKQQLQWIPLPVPAHKEPENESDLYLRIKVGPYQVEIPQGFDDKQAIGNVLTILQQIC